MKRSSILGMFAAATIAGFCGCASDSGSAQKPADQAKTEAPKDNRTREEKLRIGMSTDEVKAAIGDPRHVSVSSDGSQVWVYNDAEKAFIPNYTLFGGKIHSTIVMFDNNARVKSWNSSDSGRY